MIDTIALALGHALLGVALLRLALRADVDRDPLIARLTAESAEARKTRQNAARRPRADRAALPADSGDGAPG